MGHVKDTLRLVISTKISKAVLEAFGALIANCTV
jgi:hypothetical protein